MQVQPVYSIGQLSRFANWERRTTVANLKGAGVPIHYQANGKPALIYLHELKSYMPDLYQSLLLTIKLQPEENP